MCSPAPLPTPAERQICYAMDSTSPAEERILILAPVGRDGPLAGELLAGVGIASAVCHGAEQVANEVDRGAGALLVTQEALNSQSVELLRSLLASQPVWSDLPVILLVSGGAPTPVSRYFDTALGPAANVTLIERPVRTATLVSAVRTALRARRRQYQARDQMLALARSEAALRDSQARLQRLYGSGLVGIVSFDLDGRITDANDRFLEMVGYTRADLQAGLVNWARMTPPEYADVDARAIGQLKEAGVDVPYEKEFIRKDGSRLPIIAGAATLDDGRHDGIAFVLDITERKRLEEDRRVLLAQLEGVLDAMPETVIVRAANGDYIRANRTALSFYGVDSAQSLTRELSQPGTLWDLTTLTGEPISLEDYPSARALRGETTSNFLAKVVRRDTGQEWYKSFNAAPVVDELGQLHMAAMTVRDVTAQVEAQQERERLLAEVQTQRALLEAIVENAPAGIAVFRGRDLVYEVANPAYRAIAPGKTYLGRRLVEVWPELADEFEPMLVHTLETGNGYFAVDAPVRLRRTPRGRIEEVFLTFAFVPLPSVAGVQAAVLNLVTETTVQVLARKKEEQMAAEARRQAGQMAALLTSVRDGITVIDAQGHIVLRNEAARQLTLLSDEEAEGVNRHAARRFTVDGTPIPREQWAISRLARGERVVDSEYILERPDGTRRRVITSGSGLHDEQGRFELGIMVTRDVTDMRALEESREDFIRSISHDLRQPLTVIQGHAQILHMLLRKRQLADGRIDDSLTALEINARRIGAMINDLVESARLEGGKLRLNKEPAHLAGLLLDFVDRSFGPDQKARVEVVVPEEILIVPVDPERLERAVVNLVGNALKFSPEDSLVTVSAAQDNGEAVVSVSDRGIGIPTDDVPNLFERFYRSRTTQQKEGLGLGLYIARLIVEAHGGRLWVESEPGQGSTFRFTLPLS